MCLLYDKCDESCKGYNPKTHVCNCQPTKTATISEEFGPEQVTHSLNMETSDLVNRLIELRKKSPQHFHYAIRLAKRESEPSEFNPDPL